MNNNSNFSENIIASMEEALRTHGGNKNDRPHYDGESSQDTPLAILERIENIEGRTAYMLGLICNLANELQVVVSQQKNALAAKERIITGFNRIGMTIGMPIAIISGLLGLANGNGAAEKAFYGAISGGLSGVFVYGTVWAIGWIIRGFMR
jgi:hypothetical protein